MNTSYRTTRDVKGILTSAIARSPGSKVGSVAKFLLTGHLLKEGENQAALNNALALVDHDDTLIAKHALYDAGSILWYRLTDKEAGSGYFRKLIADYPDDPLSHSALSTLGESPSESPETQPGTAIASADPRVELHNYPNPFNPVTVIRFTLPADGNVSLKVFDVLGREVATLLHEEAKNGGVQFNAMALPSGIYFYKLRTTNHSLVQKMVLMR